MAKAQSSPSFGVVILAAGLGKRMRSSRPKVLHELSGQPLLFHVLHRVQEVCPNAPVGIVVGHGREEVESLVREAPELKGMNITFIVQDTPKGTGHAAQCVMNSEWGQVLIDRKLPLLVLPGDLPLISSELVEQMVQPLKLGESLRLLTCQLSDPAGYGRVLRKGKGKAATVSRIVEEKDAGPKEKQIREVAVSIYFFDTRYLKQALSQLSNQNAQGEYYLTDVVEFSKKAKKKVAALLWKHADELRGVNDLWELTLASQWMNQQIIKKWAKAGVRFLDPMNTTLDVSVEFSEGVVVHPGVQLLGRTSIGRNSVVGPHVVLQDVEVGENVQLKAGTVAERSVIGSDSKIGPYAHLRPDSRIGAHAKIGNFVELKKTQVGDYTSIAHLSYLGDAEVGSRVNIGCGFVTCNFDGKRKHKTLIEDDVFMGSDCQTVAPVLVGKGAYVASGSTITEDVPSNALAIGRSRQVNKPGYASKLRER